jgi:hypothetical protein
VWLPRKKAVQRGDAVTHKLGVDFGTTYCKIAYLAERDNVQMFRYPGATGNESISTALVAATSGGKLAASLADSASGQASAQPTVPLQESYKTLLQFNTLEQWFANGWAGDKSPAEVTREYFRLLLQDDRHSFTHEVGPIASLVVTVPETWHRSPRHLGPQTLRKIFLDELALPLTCISSEAVCAAAYFAYRYQQSEGGAFTGNLLVCDAGGATFKVTLCRLCGPDIEVLDHEGSDDTGLGCAGTAFDRNAVTTAYIAAHGAPPVPDGTTLRHAQRAFETTKIREHHQLLTLLDLQREAPELSDTPLYVFQPRHPHRALRPRYTLDAAQLQDAFRPIQLGMVGTLSRLSRRIQDKGWAIDQVALVGGFSHFPLAQTTILNQLELGAHDARCLASLSNSEGSTSAVARGAALIAGGIVQPPTEYYPHTLGIFAHRKQKGVMVEDFLPIIEAGKVRSGQGNPCFARDGTGKPLALQIEQRAPAPLLLYQCVHGTGEPRACPAAQIAYPLPGLYHLGLVVDQVQRVSVLFKSVATGDERVFPLGQLRCESGEEET